MTSGQGSDPHGGSGGAPGQGGPPGFPPAPPSQSPYGPPSGYGYAPAPSAPTGWGPGAPPAMERPVTVRAGLGAFIASVVLGLVSQVVTLLNWDEVVDWTIAQGQLDAANTGVDLDVEQLAELGARVGVIVGLLFVALYLLFIWFAWKGRNWARIVLWVLFGLGAVFGLVGLSAGVGGGPLPFVTALGWFQLLISLAGIVLLAMKPSNDWFTYQRWLRQTGQAG